MRVILMNKTGYGIEEYNNVSNISYSATNNTVTITYIFDNITYTVTRSTATYLLQIMGITQ